MRSLRELVVVAALLAVLSGCESDQQQVIGDANSASRYGSPRTASANLLEYDGKSRSWDLPYSWNLNSSNSLDPHR